MRARDHESEIRERAKESQREFRGEKIRPFWQDSALPRQLLTSLHLSLMSKPRDGLSGRPFPIEHAYHLAGGHLTLSTVHP